MRSGGLSGRLKSSLVKLSERGLQRGFAVDNFHFARTVQVTTGATADVVSERVTVSGVSGRYAMALFDLAKAEGALDAVLADLDAISQFLGSSDDLRRLIRSPLLGREQQAGALNALLSDVSKFSKSAAITEMTRNFVGVVAMNGRLGYLEGMIADFGRLLAADRGEITAKVTAAHALSDKQLAALKDKLKAMAGRDVNLEVAVDEALIGGLIVKLGSRMIDSSLKTKLNNLQVAMKEVG
jgi:F-type H+-transporting ATPase subunit delta